MLTKVPVQALQVSDDVGAQIISMVAFFLIPVCSGQTNPYRHGNWHPEVGHNVEGGNAYMNFRHLGFEKAGGQPLTEQLFKTIYSVLSETATVIANRFFSFRQAFLGNDRYRLGTRMIVLPWHSVFPWRNRHRPSSQTPGCHSPVREMGTVDFSSRDFRPAPAPLRGIALEALQCWTLKRGQPYDGDSSSNDALRRGRGGDGCRGYQAIRVFLKTTDEDVSDEALEPG